MKKLLILLLAVCSVYPLFAQEAVSGTGKAFLSSRPGIQILNRPDSLIDLKLTEGDKTLYIRDIEIQSRIDSKYLKAVTGTQKSSEKKLILMMIPGDEIIDHLLFTREKDATAFKPYYIRGSFWRAGEDFNTEEFLEDFFDNFTVDINFPGGGGEKLAAYMQAECIKAFKPFSPIIKQALQVRISGIQVESDIPEWITFPGFKTKGLVLSWTDDVLSPMIRPLYRATYERAFGVSLDLKRNPAVQGTSDFNLKINLSVNPDGIETETYIYKFRNAGYEYQQIVSALEQAWFLKGNAVAAQVHFHEPTRLFMITGLPSELNTARQILEQLDTPAENADKADGDEDGDTKELIKQVKEQNQRLSEQYTELIQVITQLKNAVDALYVK